MGSEERNLYKNKNKIQIKNKYKMNNLNSYGPMMMISFSLKTGPRDARIFVRADCVSAHIIDRCIGRARVLVLSDAKLCNSHFALMKATKKSRNISCFFTKFTIFGFNAIM